MSRLDGGADCPHLAPMSDTLEPGAVPSHPDSERTLAMINYGLLFFSIFFAGVPAVIAVALAYSQKSRASPSVRAHYRFQIGLFWGGFFLALLAGLLGLSGVVLALGELLLAGGESAGTGFRIWNLHIHGEDMILVVCGVLLTATDAVLLMACSAFGFVRLASNRALGKSAA